MIDRCDGYSLIAVIDFYANSLVRPKELAKKGRAAVGWLFIWLDRCGFYSLIGGIVFMPISLVYAKEIGERKRTKGVPLEPLRRSRFNTRAESLRS